MAVFWVVAPYSLVDTDLMMEATSSSEASIGIYQAVQRNIPEDSHLHK
jgi:hypothetical protein